MGGQNVKNTIVDNLLQFVAPHLCCGCGKIGSLLCDHCKYDIIKKSFNACILCGKPNSDGICMNHELPYHQAWMVGIRKGTLQRLIGGFKFENMKAAARDLARLLDERLPPFASDTILIPVPTAPAHIRERGYDHTLLMTQYLGQMRGLAVERRLLGRKETATQHLANRQDRIKQAVSAFRVTGAVRADTPYVLIDDVMTTGSTINQASLLLHEAGIQDLSIAVVARQALD